jgi:hypothetical protein
MTTYTLIAYTEGGSGWYDRCGDYNEGDPSELDINYYDDPKECGFMWAYTERQYETTKLLIDGRDPHGYDGPFEGDDALIALYDEADRYRDERSTELKAEHDAEKTKQAVTAAAQKAAEEARRRAITEQAERAQLDSLMKKYGGAK